MEDMSTLEEHKKTPEISIDQHVRKCQLELSDFVLKHKTIYLDTNYWLTLRDVSLGKRTDKLSKRFYDLVITLSGSGSCLFPISETIFVEVLKQSDETTLNETITLIDRMSKGVTLTFCEDRTLLEILYYLYDKTGRNTHSVIEIVWTKLSYVLGYTHPNLNLSIETNNLLQKSLFDHMWNISLREIIDVMKSNGGVIDTRFGDMSKSLNEGKFSHSHENNSFKKMFLSEIGGTVDANRPLIEKAFQHMFQKESGFSTDSTLMTVSDESVNMFYNLFKLNKISTELPSFRIPSGLHAAVRWDKKQKYQTNDIHDFGHASAALPYCNYFFTERRLSHLITQNILSYDSLYGCSVKGSVKGAVEELENING